MVLSNNLKKIIVFVLIVGILISVCNVSFCAESVVLQPFYTEGGLFYSVNTNSVVSVSGGNLNVFDISSYGDYVIISNYGSSDFFVYFSNDIPSLGDSFSAITIPSKTQFSFNKSDYEEFSYLSVFSSSSNLYQITFVSNGLTGFIDNISYSLSFGNLSGVWVVVVPILAISVLFGLGFYFIKRILNKTKKRKGGV